MRWWTVVPLREGLVGEREYLKLGCEFGAVFVVSDGEVEIPRTGVPFVCVCVREGLDGRGL